MPNGRRRQSNTRHANRQRHLQSVRAEAVLDEAPPVVIQAEAVTAENRYSEQAVQEALEHIEGEHQREIEEMKKGHQRAIDAFKRMNDNKTEQINKLDDEKRTTQRVARQFMDKYDRAKEGTLLAFQEVELEDKDKEINDLTYMLEKAIDKVKEMKVSEADLMKVGEKAFFLMKFIKDCDSSQGAVIEIDGKMVKVLTDEEKEYLKDNVTEERRLSGKEFAKMMADGGRMPSAPGRAVRSEINLN